MRKRLSSAICASAILLGGVSLTAVAPAAHAQVNFRIGFNFFHDRLASSGRWFNHPLWGEVWRPRPRLVGADFQPYTNGYWALTGEYGWYWVSDDPFDDVVYHYGRWVYDPQSGWLWVPGYTWAPAWVVWREGYDYTGWMPMPPDEAFLTGTGFSVGFNLGPVGIDFYRRWYGPRVNADRFFVFVDNRHLIDRDYRRFRVPRDRVVTIINRTRPVTRFEIVNNRVVNRGVDVKIIEKAAGRRIAPVSARGVVKSDAVITTVDEAKQIRQRERAQHPIEAEKRVRENRGGNEPLAGAPSGGNESTAGQRERNRNQGGNAGENENAAGPAAGADTNAAPGGETPKKTRNRGETGAAPSGAEAGPDQANPATGEGGKKKGNKNDVGAPESGNRMTGPASSGAGTGATEGNEPANPPAPKRRKGAGAMNAPSAGEEGGNNPGMMSGPNTGPGNAQSGGTSGKPSKSSSMSAGENESGNAEAPKKKKKPKETPEDQTSAPQQ